MSDEVVQTPFGKFLVNPRDGIESTLKAGTLWDGPGFLQVIAKEYARFGERGTTILDVGANVGSFSVYCASQGAWRVIAVEPVPQTMLRLKANLDLNKEICADCVIPLEVAAYHDSRELAPPYVNPNDLGATFLQRYGPNEVSEHPILAEPLDRYGYLYGDAVSLIKVDAQGCDGEALFGLRRTIEQHHPVIVFEWEEGLALKHSYTLVETLSMLVSKGYQVWPWPSQPNNYLAVVTP